MTPEEQVESAARVLYCRDGDELGLVRRQSWEQLDETGKAVYIEAVGGMPE